MQDIPKIFIVTNSFPEKKPLFSTNEFKYVLKNYKNIRLVSFSKHNINSKTSSNIIMLNLFEGFKEFFSLKMMKKQQFHFKIFRYIKSNNIKELLKNIHSYFLALAIIRMTDIKSGDLVFSYWLSRSSRIAFYLNKLIGTEYICQGHGSDIYIYPPENLNIILQDSLKIITVGDKNKRYLCKKYNVPQEKVIVFRQGVTKSFIELLLNEGNFKKTKDKKIFLTVGSYKKVKGIDLLLDAIKLLVLFNDISNNVEFRIYGSGNKYNHYKKFIVENDLEQFIYLNGWIEREDLAKELKKVDCYILPSRSEGLPNVLMEACAASLPIIATNVGSVSEIAVNGYNALLVDDISANTIAKAILEFLNFDDKKLDLMSRNSFELYNANYNLEQNLKEKYDYVQEINTNRDL